MEAENQKIIFNFASLLDGSLKDLHTTIMGSVSQQQKQFKCMEDHVCSHLESKSEVGKLKRSCFIYKVCLPCCPLNIWFMIIFFQAAQALESRINKMAEIYTSGVGTLKELANTLHMKASSDMEEIQSKVSTQTLAVENVITQEILVVLFCFFFNSKLHFRCWLFW